MHYLYPVLLTNHLYPVIALNPSISRITQNLVTVSEGCRSPHRGSHSRRNLRFWLIAALLANSIHCKPPNNPTPQPTDPLPSRMVSWTSASKSKASLSATSNGSVESKTLPSSNRPASGVAPSSTTTRDGWPGHLSRQRQPPCNPRKTAAPSNHLFSQQPWTAPSPTSTRQGRPSSHRLGVRVALRWRLRQRRLMTISTSTGYRKEPPLHNQGQPAPSKEVAEQAGVAGTR